MTGFNFAKAFYGDKEWDHHAADDTSFIAAPGSSLEQAHHALVLIKSATPGAVLELDDSGGLLTVNGADGSTLEVAVNTYPVWDPVTGTVTNIWRTYWQAVLTAVDCPARAVFSSGLMATAEEAIESLLSVRDKERAHSRALERGLLPG